MVFVYIKKGRRKRKWELLILWENEPASEQTGREGPSSGDTQVRDLGEAEPAGMKEALGPDVQRAGEPVPEKTGEGGGG